MNSARSFQHKLLAVTGSGLILIALGVSATSAIQQHNAALQLSWDGVQYSSSTDEGFFGTPIIVPGDSARRTLLIRNDGPSDAILRGVIHNVALTHDRADGFYDKLLIDWNTGQTSMRQLAANGETTIVDMQLGQGEEIELTIGYHFPVETVEGNAQGEKQRLAGFDVRLEIVGMSPTDES